MQFGLTMAGCIIFCFFIGRWIDSWFHFKGIFAIIFTILGIIGGANIVYREIIKITEEKTDKL
jgi:F0F1-type ATP synthase assembly protein I